MQLPYCCCCFSACSAAFFRNGASNSKQLQNQAAPPPRRGIAAVVELFCCRFNDQSIDWKSAFWTRFEIVVQRAMEVGNTCSNKWNVPIGQNLTPTSVSTPQGETFDIRIDGLEMFLFFRVALRRSRNHSRTLFLKSSVCEAFSDFIFG